MKEEWKTRQTYLLEGSIQMARTYNSTIPTNVMSLFPMSVEEERKFWINLGEIFYGRTARK